MRRLVIVATLVVVVAPACGGRTTTVSGGETTTTLREIVCNTAETGMEDEGAPGRDDCDSGPFDPNPRGDGTYLLVLGYDCKVRDHTGRVTATTTPNRVDGTCGQLDPIKLDAPRTVAAGAHFDISFTTAIPADQLETGFYAWLRRDGRPVWRLTADEATRDATYQALEGPTRRGYGPFTLKAPPEPGVYDLCKEALWAGHGAPGRGYVSACALIEVTAA